MSNRVKNIIKWHGGKYYLAKTIVAMMPEHQEYDETHAGALSPLFAKDPVGVIERVTDVNRNLTNFWTVIRDDSLFKEFCRQVTLTPFGRETFEKALARLKWGPIIEPDISAAVDFFIVARMSRQGLMREYCTPTSRTRRGMHEHVSAYIGALENLYEVHYRLQSVEILTQSAEITIRENNRATRFCYMDPPYLHSTRVNKQAYGPHEMSAQDHAILLALISPYTNKPPVTEKAFRDMPGNRTYSEYMDASQTEYAGKFLLSGYDNVLYQIYMQRFDWHKTDISIVNHASSKKEKKTQKATECLWSNYVPKVHPDQISVDEDDAA